MSTTNLEPIKQQILDLIQHDPDVKYIFLGWVTDQFVPKTDYSKLLDEIKQLREESNENWDENRKRWDESDKRWDENRKRWDESDKRWDENRKRWDENQKYWDKNQKRWDENQKYWDESAKRFEAVQNEIKELRLDMQQGFKKVERKINRLGTRWGIHAETSFRESMASILTDFTDVEVTLWREMDDAGHVFKAPCWVELDVVIASGKRLVVAEIKSLANRNDIVTFYRVTEVYEEKTGLKPDRRILIAAEVEPSARQLAEQLGLEIFAVDETED